MHALIVLAKAPGVAKTRLAREIGAPAAARLADAFVRDTLEACARVEAVELLVCYAPGDARSYFAELAPGARLVVQPQGDLGARLCAAFDAAFALGATRAVVIGTDAPQLPPRAIADAFGALAQADAVIGPALDGGYWLIGLRAPQPALFAGIEWSSERVLEQTLARAQGLALARLDEDFDVDDRAGLERLERRLASDSGVCRHTARAIGEWRSRGACWLAAGLLAALAGCATVDFDYPKEASHAPRDTGETAFGRFSAGLPLEDGRGAFHLMPDGIEALAARLIMARHAERSIDAQYYLIKADPAGYLFLDALLERSRVL